MSNRCNSILNLAIKDCNVLRSYFPRDTREKEPGGADHVSNTTAWTLDISRKKRIFLEMGRKPKTSGSKKGFTQLNAKVPAQLLLQFNNYWQENAKHWDHDDNQGRRDDLVVIALKQLMTRKPPHRARRAASEEHPAAQRLDRRDSVIVFAHRQAKAIVDATAEFEPRRKRRRRTG